MKFFAIILLSIFNLNAYANYADDSGFDGAIEFVDAKSLLNNSIVMDMPDVAPVINNMNHMICAPDNGGMIISSSAGVYDVPIKVEGCTFLGPTM